MYTNGITAGNYMAKYEAGQTQKTASGKNFASEINQAAGTGRPLTLHGTPDAEEGEKHIFSTVNAITGVSMSVYEGKDFDEENPVYHVKIWDADGNMTERVTDVLEIDAKNCDRVDMFTYAGYLSSSGKCPDATLRCSAALAESNGCTFDGFFQKKNWVDILEDFMQMQYDAGNIKGYLGYKNLLTFL